MTNSQRAKNKTVSATLIIGASVSALLAVIPAIITSTTGSFSIVVGLAGITITLQIEMLSRLTRRDRLTHHAFQIIEALESAPELAKDLEKSMVVAGEIMSGQTPALVREATARTVSLFRHELDELRRGEFRVQSGSGGLLVSETRATTTSIRATSILGVDEAWWSSPAARQYWEENIRALARGVKVTRVFIYEGSLSSTMQIEFERQSKAGVEIYAVSRDLLTPGLFFDVVIFDERLVYDITLGADSRDVRRVLITDTVKVQTAILKFESLMQHIFQYQIKSGTGRSQPTQDIGQKSNEREKG